MKITDKTFNGREFNFEGAKYTGMNFVTDYYPKNEYTYDEAIAKAESIANEYAVNNGYNSAILRANKHTTFNWKWSGVLLNRVNKINN